MRGLRRAAAGAGRRLSTDSGREPRRPPCSGGDRRAVGRGRGGEVAADGVSTNELDFTGNYKLAPRLLLAATGRRGASAAIVFRRRLLDPQVLNLLGWS